MGDGDFEEVSPLGGVFGSLIAASRGVALGDLDNDGDIDITVINRDASIHLLRNRASSKGGWIMLRLLNRKGNDAIGALVRIETEDTVQWRQVAPNEGYCSSHDPTVHFGLGSATRVEKAAVRWPDSSEEEIGPLNRGAFIQCAREYLCVSIRPIRAYASPLLNRSDYARFKCVQESHHPGFVFYYRPDRSIFGLGAPPIFAIIFWNLPIFFIICCICPKRLRRLFNSATPTPLPLAIRIRRFAFRI